MSYKTAMALSLLACSAYAADEPSTTAAQVAMFDRINAVVDRRARELGLDKDVVTYCRIEMSMHTDQVPDDGSIPFGVNYRTLSAESLKNTIDVREAYEKTFLLLCLARAKRDLSLVM